MSIRNRIKAFFANESELLFLDELRKTSQFEALLASGSLFETKPAKTDDYLDLYTKLSTVYSCVFLVANAIAQVPLLFYDIEKSQPKQLLPSTKHPIFNLFRKSSPRMPYYDFMEATVSFTELCGNGYWEIVKHPVYDKAVELYVIRPDYVEAQTDTKKLIKAWEINVNGAKIYFEPDEIAHFKYFSSVSDMYGLAPTAPANDSAILDLYATKFNKIYFKHGARLNGIIERERGLGDESKKRVKHELEQEFSGWDKAFRIPILPPGMKYKATTSNHKDMEFGLQKELAMREVCRSYGVPSGLVGDVTSISYASLSEQRKMFYLETILPKLEKYSGRINLSVIEPSYPEIITCFDKGSIDALKEEEAVKAAFAGILIDKGIMTANEIRERYYNLPKVSWGDEAYMRRSLRPASMVCEADLSQEDKVRITNKNNENGHQSGLLIELMEELIEETRNGHFKKAGGIKVS
jgi:HK97 family phage portal protein